MYHKKPIHAPTKAEHDKILKTVLAKCAQANLKLNLKKCRFERAELKYLGHIIGNGQIKSNPAKIQAITQMPEPTCPEDVKRIIGMATYLAKFCPNLSENHSSAAQADCKIGFGASMSKIL